MRPLPGRGPHVPMPRFTRAAPTGRGVLRRALALALLAGLGLGAPGCASAPEAPEPIDAELALDDSLARLHEVLRAQALAAARGEDPHDNIYTVLNSLERLMPSWETHQRSLSEEPLEGVLMRTVVSNFDNIVEQLRDGAHERRVVAAWALGFSRVPDNDLQDPPVPSRHEEAIAELLAISEHASDDILRNAMIALWKLADPRTPIPPLADLVINHHDGLVRANAALAMGAVLREDTAHLAEEATLVALGDPEPKVRLHAASIARRNPAPSYTRRIEQLIADEEMARIRANMAAALGVARSISSAPKLVPLLDSPRIIESSMAHQALVAIFGEDLGDTSEDWESVLP